MILDSTNEFSDAQGINAVVSTLNSTKYVDFGPLYKSIVSGAGMKLYCKIHTAVTGGGSSTVNFQIQTADNSAFSSGEVVIAATGAIAVATLVAGYEILLPNIPTHKMKRYCRLRYVIGGDTTTAGAVDACLLIDKQTN